MLIHEDSTPLADLETSGTRKLQPRANAQPQDDNLAFVFVAAARLDLDAVFSGAEGLDHLVKRQFHAGLLRRGLHWDDHIGIKGWEDLRGKGREHQEVRIPTSHALMRFKNIS